MPRLPLRTLTGSEPLTIRGRHSRERAIAVGTSTLPSARDVRRSGRPYRTASWTDPTNDGAGVFYLEADSAEERLTY